MQLDRRAAVTTPTESRIYLDHNASTPLAPSVAAKMRGGHGRRIREPFQPSLGRRAGPGARRARESPGRGIAWMRAGGNRVHERRQRIQQLRTERRVLRPCARDRNPARHHHPGGAPGHRRAMRISRPLGRTNHHAAGRRNRLHRPGRFCGARSPRTRFLPA